MQQRQANNDVTTSDVTEYALPFKTEEFSQHMNNVMEQIDQKNYEKTKTGAVRVGVLSFEKLKPVGSGKMAYVNLVHPNGTTGPLIVQSEWLSTPFGGPREPAEEYRQPGKKKYSLDVSFRGYRENERVGQFHDAMRQFDESVLFAATQGQFKIKPSSTTNKDVLATLMTKCVKVAVDRKTGEETDKYAPTLKVAVPYYADGERAGWGCTASDVDGNEYDDLADIVPAKSHVRAILQCVGVWAMQSGGFGCKWKVIRFEFRPNQVRTFRDFDFRDSNASKGQLGEMIKLDQDQDGDDDDDDDANANASGGDEDEDEILSD